MRAVLVAVVTVCLSGCVSDRDSSPPTLPGTITDPRDLNYLNGTPGSHVHDYWNGQAQVLVLNLTGPKGCSSYSAQEAKLTIFRPPEGHFVPQGTGLMEARLSWVETQSPGGLPPVPNVSESSYSSMELWIKTAQDSALHRLQPVENGQSIFFNITNRDADPPHYTVSLWNFESVAVNEVDDSTSFCGQFHLSVIAHRTLPLEVYPPHPDPWLGRTNITLVEEHKIVVAHLGAAGYSTCLGACANTTYVPPPGVVVPYSATTVRIVVDLNPLSIPIDLMVLYHGANTLEFREATIATTRGSVTIYEIVLEPGMGDSPYANQTIWEFRVRPAAPDETGPWRGEYTFAAYALK